MSSFLRPLAYRYRWIYDTVTAVSALSVGGVKTLRALGLEALQPQLQQGAAVLDLCCGSGEAAAPWLAAGFAVTGLDVSPRALQLAKARHPTLQRVEGLAEDPPLRSESFSAIQLSVALHEFHALSGRWCCAVLCACSNPGVGWWWWICIRPAPGCDCLSRSSVSFLKTDTASAMLEDDLPAQLRELGFTSVKQELLAGQALQRITAMRPIQPEQS